MTMRTIVTCDICGLNMPMGNKLAYQIHTFDPHEQIQCTLDTCGPCFTKINDAIDNLKTGRKK